MIQLIGTGGKKIFQALLPDAYGANVHEHMHMNPHLKDSLNWYAYDTADKIMPCRFTFSFNDGAHLVTFLAFAFKGHDRLINEFTTPGSRSYKEGPTTPPHPVDKAVSRMSIDGEEYANEGLGQDSAPYDKEEEEELCRQEVIIESQI